MSKGNKKGKGAATRRKKKLALSDFTRCNPAATRKSTNKCLPSSVYSSVAKRLGVRNDAKSVAEAVGCGAGEEHCLLDKAPMGEEEKKELRKQYLRPRRPKAWKGDPDQWLDNFNIMAVMKQYEEAYPWFTFLGVFPIDFSAPDPYQHNGGAPRCLYKETCNLKLTEEYAKGTRGIGMVFNLDPHFKSGSHWVALYIDLHDIKKPGVWYNDSYGYKVPALIARLMRSFKLQIKGCELGFNARRFQYGDSECGMFSLYFLICMICGIPFKSFCKSSVDDGFMLALRNILFAN
jgi:hypothetical protein